MRPHPFTRPSPGASRRLLTVICVPTGVLSYASAPEFLTRGEENHINSRSRGGGAERTTATLCSGGVTTPAAQSPRSGARRRL